MSLNEWFHVRGPVFLRTCAKYPMRRERSMSELSRIGVDFEESFDDGSLFPNLKHVVGERKTSRSNIGHIVAMINFLLSDKRSDGMWIIEDDIAFLQDVDLLTRLCASLTFDMSYMRGICLGSRPPDRKLDACRNVFSMTKVVVDAKTKFPFSWGMSYFLNSDVCRYVPRIVAKKYVKLATNGKMSVDALVGDFKNPTDVAFSKLHSRLSIPICVPSSRICVQDFSCEKGLSVVDSLVDPNRSRLDTSCPSCFPDPMNSYNISRKE